MQRLFETIVVVSVSPRNRTTSGPKTGSRCHLSILRGEKNTIALGTVRVGKQRMPLSANCRHEVKIPVIRKLIGNAFLQLLDL
ncbi:hypothetical protein NPIL_316091 [Nephila pilipes]|uniref:Uncharacterized protein n=1 Tax=Nephila pilipes TaxID=299642 RepID=A0A8X6NG60_NEPPI|nr:hypothetical protein NPIL_316091 [Nephila pilipes]